jgi:hypothetical protein
MEYVNQVEKYVRLRIFYTITSVSGCSWVIFELKSLDYLSKRGRVGYDLPLSN